MSTAPAPWRRRGVALASAFVLCATLAGCDPETVRQAWRPTGMVPADVDTFSVSSAPTAGRSTDTVMRVMASGGKTKIGYASFRVEEPDTSTFKGILYLTPRQSGFSLQVLASGPISADTTHVDRPALGRQVGALDRTAAGTRHAIPVAGVPVSGGRVTLAFTTTSPYELELVSFEGAVQAQEPDQVPTLVSATTKPAPPRTAASGAEPTPPPTTTSPPATTPPVISEPSPPAPATDGWQLTFGDEFDGTRVDPAKWNIYDQGKGDSVESPKATTCPRADNVSVGGGTLVMRTQKANGACTAGQAHSGAGMNTWGRFAQAGGRFEVRGRWTHAGNYLWGGFWTHGNGSGFSKYDPTEIDTWEYIGKEAEPNLHRFKPAIHYDYTCEGTCGMRNVQHLQYDVTAWHTYAVEWEPSDPSDPTTMEIRFFLDGQQIAQFDQQGTWRVTPTGKVLEVPGAWGNSAGAFPNPFGMDRPHQLVLSAWVGAPGVSPQTVGQGYAPSGGHADLEIDYVRVYQRG